MILAKGSKIFPMKKSMKIKILSAGHIAIGNLSAGKSLKVKEEKEDSNN